MISFVTLRIAIGAVAIRSVSSQVETRSGQLVGIALGSSSKVLTPSTILNDVRDLISFLPISSTVIFAEGDVETGTTSEGFPGQNTWEGKKKKGEVGIYSPV